jgi:hypothetical protein
MLIIRNDQMRMLQAYMTKPFENLMFQHVKEFFPEEFASLGEDTVRETIRYGIDCARTYEITIEYDVSRYINLMFTFGRDYDIDPALPWVEEILINTELSGLSKMDRLYVEAEKHIKHASAIGKIREGT